jgi:chromosome segregation ATPase
LISAQKQKDVEDYENNSLAMNSHLNDNLQNKNSLNVVKKLHARIAQLEEDKENLLQQITELKRSKQTQKLPSYDEQKDAWEFRKRIETLEKYNNDLKVQLKKTTDALADKIRKDDVRQSRIKENDESKLNRFKPINSEFPSFNNTFCGKGMMPFDQSHSY